MYFNTALTRKKAAVQEISIYGSKYGGITYRQLSKELYTFTALETLYISDDFLELHPEIANLQQLTSLYINSRLLKTLPEEIGELQQLRSLTIIGEQIETLPDSIGKLKKLNSLSIWDSKKITALPSSWSNLSQLTRLSLHRGEWTNLSAFEQGFEALQSLRISPSPLTDQQIAPIFQLKELTHLSLSESNLCQLPKGITQLQKLQVLEVAGNKLQQIPTYLNELPTLKHIDFSDNQVQEFPVFLQQLPVLEYMGWQNNAFGKYDKGLLDFPTNITNPHKTVVAARDYQTFLDKVRALDCSPKALALFFQIQNGTTLEKGQFQRAHFLALLAFDNKVFKSILIDQLLEYEQKAFEATPLTTTSELVLIGKPSLGKKEIRGLLKEKGITYKTKITPKTTHLLIGQTGIKDYSALENTHYTLISQQAFQAYFNEATKPYLLEDDSQDNLSAIQDLLTSTSIENQQLGIELIKGGGTPKALLTELFIVYKFSEDKKLAAKARQLLAANGSAALLETLKSRINLRTVPDSYLTKTKLEDLTAGTELELWKVAQFAYHYKPNIWVDKIFLGIQGAPKDKAIAFLKKVVQEKSQHDGSYMVIPSLLPCIQQLYQHCTFLEKLVFDRKAQQIDGIAALTQLKKLSFYFVDNGEFPKDIVQLPRLEEVEFTSTTMVNWEKTLTQLSQVPSLKSLYFWSSLRLGLPPVFKQFQQIEQLSLIRMALEAKDLALLGRLANLRAVYFEDSFADLDESFLVLQQIKQLHFNQRTPYSITPRISELQQLRYLNLEGPFTLEGALQLPQLESLHISCGYQGQQPLAAQHIEQLTALKTLVVHGTTTNLDQALPQFQQLEYLTLNDTGLSTAALIQVLKQLPQLKQLKHYFSAVDLRAVQQALPDLVVRGLWE